LEDLETSNVRRQQSAAELTAAPAPSAVMSGGEARSRNRHSRFSLAFCQGLPFIAAATFAGQITQDGGR
jgi:hypothetical protein